MPFTVLSMILLIVGPHRISICILAFDLATPRSRSLSIVSSLTESETICISKAYLGVLGLRVDPLDLGLLSTIAFDWRREPAGAASANEARWWKEITSCASCAPGPSRVSSSRSCAKPLPKAGPLDLGESHTSNAAASADALR